jgi:hypothetical protein
MNLQFWLSIPVQLLFNARRRIGQPTFGESISQISLLMPNEKSRNQISACP